MNVEKFTNWLKNHGCEILPQTNQYETVRWKGKETGVLYSTMRTNGQYASGAVSAYKRNSIWNGGPDKVIRKGSYKKQRAKLRERDGDDCFYCGLKLGDDETFEHLLELNQGGKNSINNGVLAHTECNQAVEGFTVSEKVNFAIEKRIFNLKQNQK